MARKFGTHIDLSRNEIQNAVLQVLSSPPSTPQPGLMYYDSTSGRAVYRGAAAWIDPTDRATHSGTQLAATISNFDTQVRTSRLDQMANPTAAVSLNSQRLTNVADPTAGTDGVNRNYVDNLVNGLDWKNSVRAATTGNITLSGTQTIDGISLVAGERVLVKDQTAGAQNGLYLVASGAWTRTVDADGNGEVTPRTTVAVEEGTLNGGSKYTVTNTGTIVIGTTAIVWGLTDTGGTSYTEGSGIDITGNVISIDTSVVNRKYSATFGGSASQAITHGLGTLDVIVQVYLLSTGETVECDVVRNSTSQVTLGFTNAPDAASMRVVVTG